ncbi:hypothetical protein IMZ48_04515, partial [Candidatus Bathyarchaeota archaeon]|nr:hypothetical protein [Candidatus Bathyarchaeota archaeon]
MPEVSTRDGLSKPSSSDGGAEIDILYENERGGFMCGIPLFSSKALGNLDPTPWTNVFHKASPTSIHTAQVPDPTWEWSWPEWRIHHHHDVDEGGWEYSFMFSRKFSWHGPRWWNSFVRRRTWIRKREKRRTGMASSRDADQHMLSADYFTVRPASETRSRAASLGTSRTGTATSAASQMTESDAGFDPARHRIEDVDSLLYVLRRARIDREKAEAVGVYLEQGGDLAELRPRMHDIMAMFIFQTSRKMLLASLTRALDGTLEALEGGASAELEARRENLEGAVRCADEEVRRLAYWSDIKGMVEGGESARAVA